MMTVIIEVSIIDSTMIMVMSMRLIMTMITMAIIVMRVYASGKVQGWAVAEACLTMKSSMLFLEAVESGPVGRLVIEPSSGYAVHEMERGFRVLGFRVQGLWLVALRV